MQTDISSLRYRLQGDPVSLGLALQQRGFFNTGLQASSAILLSSLSSYIGTVRHFEEELIIVFLSTWQLWWATLCWCDLHSLLTRVNSHKQCTHTKAQHRKSQDSTYQKSPGEGCRGSLSSWTSTTLLSAASTSYCTWLSFRLKQLCPKVKCYQDSNHQNHAKISPALDPRCVSPCKPLAIWAELRPQGRYILHHLRPVLLYFYTLYVIYSTYLCCQALSLLVLRPPGAQPIPEWECGWKEEQWIGSGWGCR